MGERARLLAAAALAGLGLAGPARGAEDLLTPGEQVVRGLERALGTGDDAQAVALLREVGDLYRYPASAAEAEALLEAAGAAARSKSPAVVVAALRALGRTGAPEAGSYLDRYLRRKQPDPEERPMVLAALGAAGELRNAVLVPALLRLAQSSPDPTVADQAFAALGDFAEADPDLRRSVTDKVLDACRSLTRQRTRWARLRAPGLRALQRLVGRRMNTVGHFEDWWKHARTKRDPWGG